MMRLNASNGCAPLSARPLMKKAGVPLTPIALAASMSPSTSFSNLRLSTQALNEDASRPRAAACSLRSASESLPALEKSRS